MWLFETVGKVMYQFVTIQAGLKFLVEFSETSLLKPIAPISFNASLPGMAAVVLDDQGNPIRDEVGELCLEKPWVGMTKVSGKMMSVM